MDFAVCTGAGLWGLESVCVFVEVIEGDRKEAREVIFFDGLVFSGFLLFYESRV